MELSGREHGARLAAAQGLAVDAITAEVVRALRSAAVEPILLKGPAIAAALYRDEPRGYVDADLLVAPDQLPTARGVLAGLGFEEQPVEHEPALGLPHARSWHRSADGAAVDLHALVAGAGVSPDELWRAMLPLTETMRIAHLDCTVPQEHALLVIVALHAAQHGAEVEKPLEDLRRAVAHSGFEQWRGAARLAAKLDAIVNFSSALRFTPEGAELAERLGLPDPRLVDAARSPRSATRLALAFETLSAEKGTRARLATLRREIAPSPAHMRWWSPQARRGRLGLTAAYVSRFVQLVLRTPPSLVLWLRSRRRRRGGPPRDGGSPRGTHADPT